MYYCVELSLHRSAVDGTVIGGWRGCSERIGYSIKQRDERPTNYCYARSGCLRSMTEELKRQSFLPTTDNFRTEANIQASIRLRCVCTARTL